MIKRIITVIVFISLSILTLTGCWDRKELNELGIVAALGIDKDEQSGGFILSSQVIRPGALSKQGGKEAPFEIVVTSGKTMFEAIRNTVKEFDRRSFFSHVKVILIDEKLARDGISNITDFITRSQELRKSTWFMIASGKKAKDLLSIEHGIDKVQASYMEGMILKQKIGSDVTTSTVIDFIKKMPGEGINPVSGVFKTITTEKITPEGKKEKREGLSLSGTAAFKKDKLIGFMDEEETMGFNIITGKVKRGTMHVDSPINDQDKIAIEIKKFRSKIVPSLKNKKISFEINIKADANITEVSDSLDISNPEEFEKVNVKFNKLIDETVKKTLQKIQRDLQTDILGFGSTFQRKYPNAWNKIKDNWDTLFPDVNCTVKVNGKLKGTGLLQKPIKVEQKE